MFFTCVLVGSWFSHVHIALCLFISWLVGYLSIIIIIIFLAFSISYAPDIVINVLFVCLFL